MSKRSKSLAALSLLVLMGVDRCKPCKTDDDCPGSQVCVEVEMGSGGTHKYCADPDLNDGKHTKPNWR